MEISKYFKRVEFKCKCNRCDKSTVDAELLMVLDDLRAFFNLPVIVKSGHRCEEHNRHIDGWENSKHIDGIAADIIVKNIDAREVYEYLDQKYPDKYGMGSYRRFTHIDVRPEKARWYHAY